LVREVAPEVLAEPTRLAAALKALALRLTSARPLDEAISSAGGVARAALDARFMLRTRPGTFCAGEMLDWEAPTGGYLLTACFATGRAAGDGAAAWLAEAG
jgi:predicted flavoprotein YhiN